MLEDIGRTACIIKYGMDGNIVVNEVQYNQPMPPNTQLTDIEVAQITTFVVNSWGNAAGFFSAGDISENLNSCSDK